MRNFPLVALGLILGCSEYDVSSGLDLGVPTETEDGGGPPGPGDVPEGFALDGWDLPREGTIDVIVYGDTSSSMAEELVTMGSVVTAFVERLAENVSDWQLAAITGDTGCAVNGILTANRPDFAAQFADAIVTPPVMNGGFDIDEMGFQNVAIGVEESGPGDCNDGLVRGGLLHLIFLSDENDESPGFDGPADYWRDYYDRIVAVHGDPLMITISAVAGPTPDGCNGADPGFGYDEAVTGTGGEFLSICDNWPDQIDLLADAGSIRDTFVLSDLPITTSIELWINGVEIAPGGRWVYDAPRNAVIFVSDPPAAGDRVDILYEVAT